MKDELLPYSRRQLTGLWLGPLLFLLLLILPMPADMPPQAQTMAAIALLMAVWWICESIPIPVTSLIPLALFPLLGLMHTKQAAAPYANHLIFLFMGGFIIALSMQRWNLHRRIAMHIVRLVGFSPSRLIFGFMCATALLSAFVSNTATTIMMLPIGMAIITHIINEAERTGMNTSINFHQDHFAFGQNLMLGIAYAASIGGMATLIGTPPNTVLAGYLQKSYGYEITFVDWLKVGVPLVLVMLPICWLWLTRIANPMQLQRVPGGREMIAQELKELGPMSTGERWVALIFSLTALGWIFRPDLAALLPQPAMVTDAAIAMSGALLLFLIPVDLRRNIFVMNWAWTAKMPWGILILFGGGLALAEGFMSSGLAAWIGAQVSLLEDAPLLLMVIAVATLVIFLTELTSNTATTAMILPILAAVAIGLGQNPLLLLIPAAIAASCAFMMPVATPPNAIVFASGYINIPTMARIGIGLNLIGIVITVAITWLVAFPVFDIAVNELPQWLEVSKAAP